MVLYNGSDKDIRQMFNGLPHIVPANGSAEFEPDVARHLLNKQPALTNEEIDVVPKEIEKPEESFGQKMARIKKEKKDK